MNTLVTRCQFVRAAGALWHDTGVHVVVLPRRDRHCDVVVLGGGGAELWRRLDEPVDAWSLAERLAGSGGASPDPEVLTDCLEDLVARGIVARLIEEDEL